MSGDPNTLRAIIAAMWVALMVSAIVIAVLIGSLQRTKRTLRAPMVDGRVVSFNLTRDGHPAEFGIAGDVSTVPPAARPDCRFPSCACRFPGAVCDANGRNA